MGIFKWFSGKQNKKEEPPKAKAEIPVVETTQTPVVNTPQTADTISNFRQNALKAYWKYQAQEWWKTKNRTQTPVCDICMKRLTPDNSYFQVISRTMRCDTCAEENLRDWGGDPDWFGKGELSNALAYYDPSGEKRAQASRLASTQDPEIQISSLITDLGDGDENIQSSAMEGLVRIGTAAVLPLIAALESKKFMVRRSAAIALGQIKDTRAVEPLIAALQDEEKKLDVDYFAGALGEIGDIRAVKPLIDALDNKNEKVCQVIVRALGNLGTTAIEPLLDSLKDTRELVRVGVLLALGQFNDPRIVEPLTTALNDKSEKVRSKAAWTLGELEFKDSTFVESLITALGRQDEYWGVRANAAQALCKIGDVRAIDSLMIASKDTNEYLRSSVAKALGIMALSVEDATLRAQVVTMLIIALKDTYWAVRRDAAEALGRLGDAQAIEPLEALLNDESSMVRDPAAQALKQIRKR